MLLAAGLHNREFAEQLTSGRRTVDRRCDNSDAKLGVGSRTEAVVCAISTKLLGVGDGDRGDREPGPGRPWTGPVWRRQAASADEIRRSLVVMAGFRRTASGTSRNLPPLLVLRADRRRLGVRELLGGRLTRGSRRRRLTWVDQHRVSEPRVRRKDRPGVRERRLMRPDLVELALHITMTLRGQLLAEMLRYADHGACHA